MRIRMRRTSRMITRVHAHAVCCCWDGSGRRCCSGCSEGAAWHRERTTRKVQRGEDCAVGSGADSGPDDASRAQKYRVG